MIVDIKFDAGKLKKTFHNIENAHKAAAKNTLNIMAFVSRKNAQKIVGDEFVLRNNFTKRSIRVEKAEENDTELQSKIGSTAKYMKLQETGGIKKVTSIGGRYIRGGDTSNIISRQYYLSRIKNLMIKGKTSRKGTEKSKRVARMYMAHKLKKFVHMKSRIINVHGINGIGGGITARTSIAYTFAKDARVRGNKWLSRSIQKPIQDAGNIYQRELKKQWKNID